MRLTVLGSGTSVPHPRRSSSAYWIETDNGTLLLDCAPSAVHRLAEEELAWPDLDAIWISHFHLDHCGGLAPFLFGTKYAAETKERAKPLRIFGPAGLRGLIAAIDGANNYRLLEQPFPVEVIEVERLERFDVFPGLEAVAMKTPHTPESLALHLRSANDVTIMFSSDTGFTRLLSTFAREVDLFILECSFVRDKPVEKHLELAEAMFLIRKASPRLAILTHLYPEWDMVDFCEEIERFEPLCDVIEARDGLRLDLSKKPETAK
jgi:ribonuclease BN (tRNA processing enzyme)